jgi:tetratricopeptide (TPR) repeat protein
MVLNRLSDEDIQRAIPDRVEPHLLFADYLSRTGQERMAEEEYFRALSHINNEQVIDPSFFHAVSQFYLRKERYEDALGIMTKAVELLPDNTGIRLTLGGLYEKLDLRQRALAEYRQILVIDPKNQPAKKRLEMILSEEK